MNNVLDPIVSEEMFAAWLDGNLSYEDQQFVEQQLMDDPEMQELLVANEQVEEDYNDMITNGYEMPDELMSDFELQPIEVIEDYEDDMDADDDIVDYFETSDSNVNDPVDYQEESDGPGYESHDFHTYEDEDGNADEAIDIDPFF